MEFYADEGEEEGEKTGVMEITEDELNENFEKLLTKLLGSGISLKKKRYT